MGRLLALAAAPGVATGGAGAILAVNLAMSLGGPLLAGPAGGDARTAGALSGRFCE